MYKDEDNSKNKNNIFVNLNNSNNSNIPHCDDRESKYEAEQKLIEEMRKSYKLKEKIFFYEFLNFLEVYIHTVLYLNNVYPREAFYAYSIYNLKFLKYLADDEVNQYINEFLKNCENFLFARYIKKIYILIVDADKNQIIEISNLEIDVADKFYILNHDEVCLNFKSILYQLYTSHVNKKNDDSVNINKTFFLCLETKESKVITNLKMFEEINSNIEDNFVKNLFKSDLIKLVGQKEICAIVDELNYSIKITRNYNE